MEKNANPHRDAGGSVLCTAIPAEPADIKTVGGMKDVCEKRETLTTCASASGANATPCTQTSDATETVSKSGQPNVLPQTPSPGAADQLSNGMGHEPSMTAAGNKEGGISKLVNSPTGEQPDAKNVQADGLDGGAQKATELAKSAYLCADKLKSASSNSNDHTVSEGPPSGSEPSIAGESRSFDSLESFSNLNSCPSSDLISEGLEDKGLALAIEYGADGTKIPCPKDRVTGQSLYHIKWIKWKEENTPIITQNENGPCPLLAIMNVLLLSWKVKLPPMMEIITAEQLMEYLGWCRLISTHTLWLDIFCMYLYRKPELLCGFIKCLRRSPTNGDGQHQIREIPRGWSSCNVTDSRSLFPLWHVDLLH